MSNRPGDGLRCGKTALDHGESAPLPNSALGGEVVQVRFARHSRSGVRRRTLHAGIHSETPLFQPRCPNKDDALRSLPNPMLFRSLPAEHLQPGVPLYTTTQNSDVENHTEPTSDHRHDLRDLLEERSPRQTSTPLTQAGCRSPGAVLEARLGAPPLDRACSLSLIDAVLAPSADLRGYLLAVEPAAHQRVCRAPLGRPQRSGPTTESRPFNASSRFRAHHCGRGHRPGPA
jgi:hypothetical protein